MEPSCVAPRWGLNTILEVTATSPRHLYSLKWSVFSDWCTIRNHNPVTYDMLSILSFLQERLDDGQTKVHVAAIAACHIPIAGQLVCRNKLVVKFLKGV